MFMLFMFAQAHTHTLIHGQTQLKTVWLATQVLNWHWFCFAFW